MKRRDHYEVLGVPRDASPEKIRRAFRAKAVKHHPDRNLGREAPEEFHQIAEAYDVLGDPVRRAGYDQQVEAEARGRDPGDRLEDFFSFFSGRPRNRVRDLERELELSLEQVLSGTDQTVEVSRVTACASCQGTGARPGSGYRRCPSCGGTGQRQATSELNGMRFRRVSACPACGGRGELSPPPCKGCHGAGRIERTEEITVPVPAGVEDGMVLQLSGLGSEGGDLLVTVRIRADPRFERKGRDLVRTQKVEVADAALGATVSVPTLTGSAPLKIPPGTQPGEVLRLRGQGLPRYGGGARGDLLVELKVEIPPAVSPQLQALYQRLRATGRGG